MNRHRIAVAAVLAALTTTVPGSGVEPGRAPEPALAHVGPDAVAADELRAEFVRRHGGHAKFLGGEAEIRAFLELVIDRRLLLQEAYRLGLDQQPEVLDTVARFAERKALEKLVAEEIDGRAKVTDDEIREAWETRTTELYQVLQLVVASRAEADEAIRQLEAGADFAQLARERSIAPSRSRGGGLDTIGWGTMPPEWEAIVFALQPGSTSAPFPSPLGWEIVRMVARTPVEKPDLAAATAKIQGILSQRKLEARRREFADLLWRKYQARLSGVLEMTPAALAALASSAPDAVLASWDGGTLDLATFAGGLDLAALAAAPADLGQRHLDELLRKTVNDALVRQEVEIRRMVERADLAAEVKTERENLMERVLYADYVLRGLQVSEEEVRAWFDAHPEDFVAPERRRMSHVVSASREEAAALRARLERGESFEEIVRAHSTDAGTAKAGGDLGWITKREVPPEFVAVLELAEGAISEPIESRFGWHLMRVTAIEPARPIPFEETRAELAQRLLERKKSAERAKWVAALREATPVVVHDEAILALAKQSNQM